MGGGPPAEEFGGPPVQEKGGGGASVLDRGVSDRGSGRGGSNQGEAEAVFNASTSLLMASIRFMTSAATACTVAVIVSNRA